MRVSTQSIHLPKPSRDRVHCHCGHIQVVQAIQPLKEDHLQWPDVPDQGHVRGTVNGQPHYRDVAEDRHHGLVH